MKAKDIAIGGIMVAISVMTLYLTAVIPINTLAILTLASCLIPITIIRSKIKTAIFVYISTTIIGFFIVPLNYVIMYALFFGIYGIIKFFIEKINRLPLEIILKVIFFNVILSLSLVVMNNFIGDISINLPIWLFFIIAQVVFLIYDYALTIIITFYIDKFHKMK